jgi:protein-L-isoaspartate(D-aspartate) O-methyltransferase
MAAHSIPPSAPLDPFESARLQMVEQQLRRRGVSDERVLAAFARVPRHEFLPPDRWTEAYEDKPIQIGAGQTISQPYMHAAMLAAAQVQPTDVVLEIGTGSGYQTALLAELAAEVFSIEVIPSLAAAAQHALARLNYSQIVIRVGDGSRGWPEAAPFDVIVVSAASPNVPATLIEQLRMWGRLVIPVGDPYEQHVWLLQKRPDGVSRRVLEGCRFVPLVGAGGFPRN